MAEAPILSIILPVYNGEAFVERAIRSVLDQELADWELIVVNDGSTDRSEEIIQKFCALDVRIAGISQENKGLSAARNAGYCKAAGKYIVFLDVDDYVEPNYYSGLVASTEKSGADFVVSGYTRDFVHSGGTTQLHPVRFENQLLSCSHDKVQLHKSCAQTYFYNVYIHVWNKIYRRDFLQNHGIMFDESIRYAEDVPYNIECLMHAKNIQFLSLTGYHYVCHQAERLTGKWRESLLDDNARVYKQIADYERVCLKIGRSEVAAGMYLRSCYLVIEKAIAAKLSYQKTKEIIQTLFSMFALNESLATLQKHCKSKEFLIYRMIWSTKRPDLVYISVALRKCLKHAMGR